MRSEKKLFLDGTDARQKTGRMDILIDDLGDFVAIYEIKATDWDRIKKKNITRNLYRHQKQLWMYIKKYVDVDNIEACPGIIYPSAPKTVGLRERVESYLEESGTPWNEIAELACQVAGKSCTIRHWPKWLLRATLAITRVISRPTYGTLSFLGHVMTSDTTAPNHGSRNLEAFFRAQQEAEVQ